MKHLPQLDGLRAVCVILTVLNHIDGAPREFINGSVGVDMFFALSGYLITTLLITELEATGRLCIACFYVRRFFRIVPLYAITFLAYFFAALALAWLGMGSGKLESFRQAWPYLVTFMSEYRPPETGNIFGHAWSLGIEEKYYLAWPLLYVALFLRRGLAWIQIALLVAALLAFSDRNLLLRGYGGLLFGSILAFHVERAGAERIRAFFARCSTGIFVGLVLGTYAFTVQTYGGNLLVSLATALLIASLIHKESFVSRVLAHPVVSRTGKLTYGIYLVHILASSFVVLLLSKIDPGFHWSVHFLMTYSASACAALVLHILIERPAIGYGRQLANSLKSGPGASYRTAKP